MKQVLSILFFSLSMLSSAQQTDYVDFKSIKTDLMSIGKDEVGGHSKIRFEILKDTDSIYVNAKNFLHIEGLLSGNIFHDYDGKHFIVKHDFRKGSNHELDLAWVTTPKKALYVLKRNGKPQIWTQGQGKYTSNWLPSIDDMNDKIEFDITVTFDSEYEVVANGKLIDKDVRGDKTRWEYDMQKPMSSYLVALAIGKYDKKTEVSKSGIRLEMYYYPKDSAKFEPTYRYTKRMFDFLEEEIGVPYPWQNYKQVPVHDFLYAGMENTSLTIFADTFVADSTGFVDRNYVNVNAHELAHQWFGDLVTEISGTHHWLHEGFATYYALLAEKDVFGEDYYYWKLYESAQQLRNQDKAGRSTSLLNPKSSSLTFYQKGAWALHMLREKVGDTAFKTGVKRYLQKHQFKNVKTDDFISEVEKASGKDLKEFVDKWLVSDELAKEEMYVSLKENQTSGFLVTIEETPFLSYRTDNNDDYIPSSLTTELPKGFHSIRSAVLKEVLSKPEYPTYQDLLNEALESGDLRLRQTLAQNLSVIPKELKDNYETLLNDKSYATIEAALYHLWGNFPEDRVTYLDRTKGIMGFSDKNVRMLWLTLGLVTPNYHPERKKEMYEELLGYSSASYGYSVREQAFTYLNGINACDEACKENLEDAAKHHNWRLQKFAKSLLNKNQ